MYKDELKQSPDTIVIDGSLVDIMDTLVRKNGTELNQQLYSAMVEAQDKGENIYLYSASYSKESLKALGVDLEKFPILSKGTFNDYSFGNEPTPHVVLGKIIDDKTPNEQFGDILKLSNDKNYIFPSAMKYDFSRDPLPEGIENQVMDSPAQIINKEKIARIRREQRNKEREEAKTANSSSDRSSQGNASETSSRTSFRSVRRRGGLGE